jgi:hypothetical protein
MFKARAMSVEGGETPAASGSALRAFANCFNIVTSHLILKVEHVPLTSSFLPESLLVNREIQLQRADRFTAGLVSLFDDRNHIRDLSPGLSRFDMWFKGKPGPSHQSHR